MHSHGMLDSSTQIRIGGGSIVLVLFGLFFAGIGGFFVAMLLSNPSSVTVNGHPGTHSDAWFPVIFVAIGLGIAGIRFGKIIDIERRCITSWGGWCFIIKKTDTSLGPWLRVEVGQREIRGSGKNSRPAVPVRLVGENGSEEIAAPREEAEACRLAERIAKAAKIVLADGSSGTTVERDHKHLDDSILLHLTAADLQVPIPGKTRIQVKEGVRGREIRVGLSPMLLLYPFMLIPFFGIFAFWYFLWYPDLNEKAAQDWFTTAFTFAPLILMIGLPSVLAVFAVFRKGLLGFTIIADSDAGLQVLGHTVMISDLEDVRIISPNRNTYLAAITDDKWVCFGYGLGRHELTYLRSLILQGLAGRR